MQTPRDITLNHATLAFVFSLMSLISDSLLSQTQNVYLELHAGQACIYSSTEHLGSNHDMLPAPEIQQVIMDCLHSPFQFPQLELNTLG